MHQPPLDEATTLTALVHGTTAGLSPSQLEDLTRYLEQRLTDIGAEGDCAYERAMGRVYLQLLTALRAPRRVPSPAGH